MREKLKCLLAAREKNPRIAPYLQMIKFGLVGVSNTLLSYTVEMVCYYVLFAHHPFTVSTDLLRSIHIEADGDMIRVWLSSALAFFTSVTNSYYWNSRYVFSDGGGKKTIVQHLAAYRKMTFCYALTGLLLSPTIKIWISGWGIPYWFAGISSLLVVIPLNFLLNKFWAFH